MACRHGLRSRKHELGAPIAGYLSGVEATEVAMDGNLLQPPPILHASESPIGEWKALEMENAVV